MSQEEELKYRLTQGRPPLFTDMRIVNDEGNELPHDGKATGDLEVRGPHVIKDYFRVSHASQLSILFSAMFTCLAQASNTTAQTCIGLVVALITAGKSPGWILRTAKSANTRSRRLGL